MQRMASGEPNENRAKWSDLHKAHLVKLLVDHNVPAYRSQNGWTKEAWNKIVRDMRTKFSNTSYTRSQIKGLEQELKKAYKILKSFTELSGFGWDYERHMVTAPDEVWAELLEKNKDARKWHQKPFPYFLDLQGLYEGRYAEGRRSRGVDDYDDIAQEDTPVHTPSPSIPAPNDSIHAMPTHEEDEVDYMHMEEPCTQPPISQPQSSNSERHERMGEKDRPRRKRDRQRTNPQNEFKEFMAMKERHADQYLTAMKENSANALKVMEEKFTIGECMNVFNTFIDDFSEGEVVEVTKLFMKDRSYREVFLHLPERNRVSWLKSMIENV